MTTAGLQDSPIARLILSQDRAHTLPPATSNGTTHSSKSFASTLPIVILTEDPVFATQIRSALDNEANVASVATLDEAAALAEASNCSILITDSIVTRSAIETCTRRLRAHDPALAFIVAGPRDHGGMFIGLQSSGAIDGFLLKPVTAGAAQLLIESATKRHRAFAAEEPVIEPTRVRRPQRAVPPTLTDAAAAETIEAHAPAKQIAREDVVPRAIPVQTSRIPRPAWSLVLLALVIVGAAAWWISSQRSSGHDTQQIITETLQRAEAAAQSGRWFGGRDSAAAHLQTVVALDPTNLAAQRALDQVASQLSKQVQTFVSEKRLAQAVSALDRLREFQPDYAELPLLDAQLTMLRDQVVASNPTPAPVVEVVKTADAPKLEITPRAKERVATREPSPPTRSAEPAKATLSTQIEATPKQPVIEPSATDSLSSAQLDTPISAPPPLPEPAMPEQSSATLAALTPMPKAPVTVAEPVSTVQPPKLVKYVPPIYPSEAYARGIEGWIQVELMVAPGGDVASAQVRDGEKRQLFSRAALAAVKQWKYQPRPQVSAATPIDVRLEFQLKR